MIVPRHQKVELVKKSFAAYTKCFDATSFLYLSRYKIYPVTKTSQFTKDILKRAMVKHNNTILDIGKLEIKLLIKLHKEFDDDQECTTFRGILLSIGAKKQTDHLYLKRPQR